MGIAHPVAHRIFFSSSPVLNYIDRFVINPGDSCNWTLSSEYTSAPFKLVVCFLIIHFFGEAASTRSQSST
jgi:hypothetical protein